MADVLLLDEMGFIKRIQTEFYLRDNGEVKLYK
jgi:hypothetical protein